MNTAEVMALPVCTASQVSLELAGSQDAYKAKDKPRLSLTVRNTSTGTCRVNLGRTASTVAVTLAESNERVWSSGDCPTDRQDTWVQLGAGSGLTETFTWERGRSKPQCATPDTTPAPIGRYLVQATLNGPAAARSRPAPRSAWRTDPPSAPVPTPARPYVGAGGRRGSTERWRWPGRARVPAAGGG
ncbi:hypothetical protein ACFQ0T_23210 [Kitasatospora gansuensis]